MPYKQQANDMYDDAHNEALDILEESYRDYAVALSGEIDYWNNLSDGPTVRLSQEGSVMVLRIGGAGRVEEAEVALRTHLQSSLWSETRWHNVFRSGDLTIELRIA